MYEGPDESEFFLYLLHLVDILCLLYIQLQEVDDSPVDIQHCCGDTSRCRHSPDNAICILKLDRCRELSSQGCGELGRRMERIFGPDATVLQQLRVYKLQKIEEKERETSYVSSCLFQ